MIKVQLSSSSSYHDDETINIEQPNNLALKCMNGQLDLIEKCQQQSANDFNPLGRHTWITTLWQTCCIIWEELKCYQLNAKQWCSPSLSIEIELYSLLRYEQIEQTLCKQIQWIRYCDHYGPIKVADKHQFIWPITNVKTTKTIGHCLQQLRSHMVRLKNGTKIIENLIEKCDEKILMKYEQKIHLMKFTSEDNCCAIYELFDCLEQSIHKVCSGNEQQDWLDYQQRIIGKISTMSLCRLYPYNTNEMDRCLHRKPDNHHHHHQDDRTKENLRKLIKQIASITLIIILLIITSIIFIWYKQRCKRQNDDQDELI
ncbi:hypothetical protein DERP_010761 [Dermatophagoides pteronyssinus]|uniref:Golgi apparatus protein 1 n=1 Tax=Dermatophagoides pteronyssinus TaxID=6956 RepID=A0ABQ8J6J7_DERPT|nr:hypothetical protein DERP_010761 [Dermatophagoides pteronyssinus]